METEKTLIREAFTKVGAVPKICIANDSNDLVRWLEATNKEGKAFTLILIDIDTDPKDPVTRKDMSVYNAAKVRGGGGGGLGESLLPQI